MTALPHIVFRQTTLRHPEMDKVAHSDPSRSFVSATARSVAGMRAKETAKGADALIQDPYAELLAGPASDSWIEKIPEDKALFLIDLLAVRTKYIDAHITSLLTAADGPKQVVILGSGLDTRPYRLDAFSGVTTFQVDFAEVHSYKNELLASVNAVPKGVLVSVGADLALPDWVNKLKACGFNQDERTFWLVEGLTGCGFLQKTVHSLR